MSNNPRPTKCSRYNVSQQAGSSDAPEAGPSTGPGTYQGSETGPLAGPFEPSPYHIDSAAQEDASGHKGSGEYNAQPGAMSNSVSDPTSTYLDQSSTGHTYPPISGPPNLHGFEQQRYHHSLLGPIPLSMHEQKQARPAEYPRLFLDTHSSGNLAAAHTQPPDAAISPSLLTVNPSFGSPGSNGQAIASVRGKVKDASGYPGRKRKAIDEDAGEEGPAPLPAQPHPYPRPMPGYVYVPVESVGQQQAGPAVYLPSYGNFASAPALMPGVPVSASAPPFAMYPPQPGCVLSASDIQASTQSAPLRSDSPASGGLRRSPRLARRRQSEDGEEASEGDGSPFPPPASPVPSHPASSVPLSERDMVRRKKMEELAQKQRDQKVDRFLLLNNLLEDYRVVIVVNKNGKKWTPQQQILQNAIAYVQNLQNVRNEMNAKLEQSEARCAQERANAASLWDTAEDCRLQLEAERKESKSWKTKKESMEHELAQLKRKLDDARCSVCDSALTRAT